MSGTPGRWLVTYDVSDDRRRTRLSNRLERVGVRAQLSVFEIIADTAASRRLFAEAKREFLDPGDALLMQPTCEACRRRRLMTGPMILVPDEPWWIV